MSMCVELIYYSEVIRYYNSRDRLSCLRSARLAHHSVYTLPPSPYFPTVKAGKSACKHTSRRETTRQENTGPFYE